MRKTLTALLGLCALHASADSRNPNTDWMPEAKLGVFMHFLPGAANFGDVDTFDVPALVKQLAGLRVRYFVLTLGQNSGYMCSPNATYEQLGGFGPNTRCSTRDLPMELADALRPHGIRLMLYLPSQTPNRDMQAVTAFGLGGAPNTDRKINAAFAQKWAQVIETWSMRYGDKVSGWWFDGAYPWCDFNEDIAKCYAAAVKKGNPKAVVAFNPGVSLKRWVAADDYTAGELNDPFAAACADRWLNDAQWHVLTFLGKTWGNKETRHANEKWIDWINRVTAKGGVVTIDMGHNPNGTLVDKQLEQMQAICDAVFGAK
ncbi:MAG: alpha-L-fucosidase [Kiritimatiellaeota bacterium]|nr:alpha-L-fucosidase [Kiritimatiellota bacterium]